MTLNLNQLEIECIIGDRDYERDRPQTLLVDVELTLTDSQAAASDKLEDTVDYAALAESIQTALENARCRMIERAARIVYELAVDDPHVADAKVVVTKVGAVAGLASASVHYP